jgi:putative transposase
MRQYIRSQLPGATCFFTVALQDRRRAWLTDYVDALRESVVRARAQRPFRIDAMVVLPDHLHAVWTLPEGDADYPLRWRLIKRMFTHRMLLAGADVGRRGTRERVLWQRRYWEHQIRDEEDFARHVEYIHFNPVKHGLVQRVADWPHSSFHRYVRQGRVAADWGLAADSAGQFGE